VHPNNPNKVSEYAGRISSSFSVFGFAAMVAFRNASESAPPWLALVFGWLLMLAAFSGVVCLVSAAFNFLRQRRKADPL
jgi:hypothetical protein